MSRFPMFSAVACVASCREAAGRAPLGAPWGAAGDPHFTQGNKGWSQTAAVGVFCMCVCMSVCLSVLGLSAGC